MHNDGLSGRRQNCMEKTQWTAHDVQLMQRCLWLASQGRLLSRPNPMVGAVIVAADGRILGEGYHARCGEGHAEVNAFASVSSADEPLLRQSAIYVSLEPCSHYGKTPPCAELIISKGVRRCVVGTTDPFARVQGRGIAMLRQAGIAVEVGLLEQECQWLNRRFFTFHRLQRPHILLKWAQTADGFLDDHGRALALSTPFTQLLMHRVRQREDAIVVGHTTWQREHPRLDARLWGGPSPRRFVLGTSLSGALPAGYIQAGSIADLLGQCREQQLQSLIVEGGGTTLRTFLQQGLYDELRVETAPVLTGGGTAAPPLPSDIVLTRQEHHDGNVISHYRRQTDTQEEDVSLTDGTNTHL